MVSTLVKMGLGGDSGRLGSKTGNSEIIVNENLVKMTRRFFKLNQMH
jgi:hypothetical protein